MRVVIQRVKRAKIIVNEKIVASIDQGILTLLGVAQGDKEEQITKAMRKVCDLRIFADEQEKMNRSLRDINGQHLIVSQFTLAGNCSGGNRPSFASAERPERAKQLYELAIATSQELGVATQGGVFQAEMQVDLVNDGPVTFVLDF